ncbi:HAMP domain-containing sensor histidine kinase [Vibrio scophthalmi]|uniref:histidine kinase n=1 Tax=Vibrio scophthalmi LMG 19158 TaxID=870967 RepID=F9RT44_9VIBR|nr:sensor histidine kinase [Vibrio scophthalmi]EGU31392.1 histidine kinase [Vibrio scophthalmi LMG 19158]
MKRILFWRLFVILSLGGVMFFSLLHSAALLSNEKMSYIETQHQQEILQWGETAQQFIEQGDTQGLNQWLTQLANQEQTWATVVKSQIDVVSGNPLNQRFWSGYGIGRNVEWKIHLDFPDNPIMEVALSPSNHHFLIILPERMRPGSYMSHAFWLFRLVIPFIALLSLTIYLYRYVMRPLRSFQKATDAFSQGNYQARVSHYLTLGNDEMSQVAKTFDMMAERTENVIEHNRNLIAEMSHEIRTPLARVEMATDCVESQIDSHTMVERIRTEVKNIRHMAEDTLTLAWLENERPNLCQESFDLTELLDAIIEDARFEYPDRTISCQMPASMMLTHSNQRALSQALENIIRNGLRYTPAGEILMITADNSEHAISITISDSGPGLDPSLTKTIFRPFFKANNQKDARKGFGVGLALAKRHIEAVNGTVEAKNGRGKGLDMVVLLPA